MTSIQLAFKVTNSQPLCLVLMLGYNVSFMFTYLFTVVLLKVEDQQERAFIYETVDSGGCPLQSCQTYSLVYVNPTDSLNGLHLQRY